LHAASPGGIAPTAKVAGLQHFDRAGLCPGRRFYPRYPTYPQGDSACPTRVQAASLFVWPEKRRTGNGSTAASHCHRGEAVFLKVRKNGKESRAQSDW
jgi:hypothetical protein